VKRGYSTIVEQSLGDIGMDSKKYPDPLHSRRKLEIIIALEKVVKEVKQGGQRLIIGVVREGQTLAFGSQ